MPIQPVGAANVEGTAVVDAAYADGLNGLDGFSHVVLLYRFHQATRTELRVTPFLDSEERGVFATRSPLRPSHIGMSVVNLLGIEGNSMRLRGVDVLDGTPLLDVKPFVPAFDVPRGDVRTGWLEKRRHDAVETRADDRFV